ncbi:hypothetical protein [Nocardia brasiliensis]|uniref:hypothetical protein n=1 Tax=Nocardia brasiliensis TaxID=37326 RepID=UPI0024580119|nr:hypothetical protein [Nocardia brasiliensis]
MKRILTRAVRCVLTRFVTSTVIVAGALTVGAGHSTAQPAALVATNVGYDCVAVIALIPIMPERVASVLPSGYGPESLLGMLVSPGMPGPAQLTVQTATCQRGVLNGVATGRHSETVRALSIKPRDSAAGYHLYNYDFATDEQRLVDTFHRAGLTARYAERLGGAELQGVGVGEAGDLRLRVTELSASPIPLSAINVWHTGEDGTGVLRGDKTDSHGQVGVGCVTAAPESSIAQLLGTTDACGLGQVQHFDSVDRYYRLD